jgi:deazaflavin-dependent oxidoreductase (nitroreductase family)
MHYYYPWLMTKAVQFDSYGGLEVLEVRDVPRPVPSAGEILVKVKAAGINISEAAIRSGAVQHIFPATFPSGQGSDLAGVVAELGSGVTGFAVGDEVIGFSSRRSSHAEYVTIPETQLTPKPVEVSWEVAGSLYVAGCTAYAAVSDGNDFNERNIAEFRANHGRVSGPFGGAPILVLHTVGARSDKPRVNIMMYLADGERYLVFPSNQGGDSNPDWYWNLKADPDVRIGDDILEALATDLQGAERDDKYALQAERYPAFAEYQHMTSRTIPVVALTPSGPARLRE